MSDSQISLGSYSRIRTEDETEKVILGAWPIIFVLLFSPESIPSWKSSLRRDLVQARIKSTWGLKRSLLQNPEINLWK